MLSIAALSGTEVTEALNVVTRVCLLLVGWGVLWAVGLCLLWDGLFCWRGYVPVLAGVSFPVFSLQEACTCPFKLHLKQRALCRSTSN